MTDETYESAVLEHKDRVYHYARSMLRSEGEAQDVTQDSLIRLWDHRDTVEPTRVRAWLLRTARNLCIDRLRKRRVRNEVDDGDAVVDRQEHDGHGPWQRLHATELGRIMADAMRSLSEDDRTVVLLREVHGMPYDEIAETLEIPIGTLKARLHRARERLRTRLVRTGVTV